VADAPRSYRGKTHRVTETPSRARTGIVSPVGSDVLPVIDWSLENVRPVVTVAVVIDDDKYLSLNADVVGDNLRRQVFHLLKFSRCPFVVAKKAVSERSLVLVLGNLAVFTAVREKAGRLGPMDLISLTDSKSAAVLR